MNTSALVNEMVFRPTTFFKRVDRKGFDKLFYSVFFLSAVSQALQSGFRSGWPVENIALSVTVGVIVSAIAWCLGSFIFAVLLHFTGSLLQGKSNIGSLFRVVVYASVPAIFVTLLMGIQYLFGEEVIISELFSWLPGVDFTLTISSLLIVLLQFAFIAWSGILLVKGIAEVQKFSVIKAIGNLLLPILLLAGIVVVFFLGTIFLTEFL